MKKPVGMSREVFALLNQDVKEGNAPLTLAPSAGQPDALLKEKRTRMVGWEFKEFHNGGRTDGLRLRHWGKNNDKSTEYTFARFNKSVKVLSYTDEEYSKHLTRPGWEKPETDELFDLCRRFDLRWPVIYDRFVGAKPNEARPVEQLKERYYEVCKLLLLARAEEGEAEAAGHPLVKFKFDPRSERERKAEFERLYHRSDQEVREEVHRLEQAKALEAKLKMEKKMVKPGGRASGLAALRASLSAHGFGGGEDLALNGLPSLAGLLDEPKRKGSHKLWLRSKDFSAKRPASEKLYAAFENRMTASRRMPNKRPPPRLASQRRTPHAPRPATRVPRPHPPLPGPPRLATPSSSPNHGPQPRAAPPARRAVYARAAYTPRPAIVAPKDATRGLQSSRPRARAAAYDALHKPAPRPSHLAPPPHLASPLSSTRMRGALCTPSHTTHPRT